MRLHTGHVVPQQIEQTVRDWRRVDQPTTPGWLESLPSTFSDLCEKWEIQVDHIVPDIWVTLVALGESVQLGPVVLKFRHWPMSSCRNPPHCSSVREETSREFMIWISIVMRCSWNE